MSPVIRRNKSLRYMSRSYNRSLEYAWKIRAIMLDMRGWSRCFCATYKDSHNSSYVDILVGVYVTWYHTFFVSSFFSVWFLMKTQSNVFVLDLDLVMDLETETETETNV